jgi:predicted dehydrogenase
VLAAGATLLTARSWAQVSGVNSDIRVAIAGVRGKGSHALRQFHGSPGARIVALCDPDRQVLAGAREWIEGQGVPVQTYVDVREMLENDDIDAVVVTTPNHWHALITIWACQAGKDVYVEKPASHSVWEGQRMVEAARAYNRIVQNGTQNRSDPGLHEAYAWLREGHLGKILLARGFCYKRRDSIGKVSSPQEVPAHIDYDLWVGPAPMKPLMRKSLHYDWHWVWDTGNGDVGNQGVHELDIARWFSGADCLPTSVISVGARLGYDDGETPNTQLVYCDYPDVPVLFEVRGLTVEPGSSSMSHYRGVRIGNVIECENGYFAGGYAYDHEGNRLKQFGRDGGGGHVANFLKAVRSRKMSDLNADVREGHLSAALAHVGEISHRLGRESSPAEVAERIRAVPAAMEAFDRMKEHLEAHAIDLDRDRVIEGAVLTMDPQTERFTGDRSREANALLRQTYRPPYVVPEKV